MHEPEIVYQVHYTLNGVYWEIELEFFYTKEDAGVAYDDVVDRGFKARVWEIEDERTISDITDEFEAEPIPTDREEHSLTASQLGVGGLV